MGRAVHRDADEAGELFREAVRDVTPLADRRRAPAPRRESTGRRAAAMADSVETPSAPLQLDDDGGRAFGVSRKTMRALSSGRFLPQATLDLHRVTSREARERLIRFFAEARASGARTVLVITGKGERSRNSPVSVPHDRLRDLVPAWLSGPLAGAVLAFTPARPEHGGAGALYVLLRLP